MVSLFLSKMNKPLQVLMADKRKKEGGLFLIKIIGSYALWKIISFCLEYFEPQWWIAYKTL
jgi:hypothetical protein